MRRAGIDDRAALETLENSKGNVPAALLMAKTGCSLEDAERALAAAGGVLSRAEGMLK